MKISKFYLVSYQFKRFLGIVQVQLGISICNSQGLGNMAHISNIYRTLEKNFQMKN